MRKLVFVVAVAVAALIPSSTVDHARDCACCWCVACVA